MATIPVMPVATALNMLEEKINKLARDGKLPMAHFRVLTDVLNQNRHEHEAFDTELEGLKRYVDAWEAGVFGAEHIDSGLTSLMAMTPGEPTPGSTIPSDAAVNSNTPAASGSPTTSHEPVTTRPVGPNGSSTCPAIQAYDALLDRLPFVRTSRSGSPNEIATNGTPSTSRTDATNQPISPVPTTRQVPLAEDNTTATPVTNAPAIAQDSRSAFLKEVKANPFGSDIRSRLLKAAAVYAAVEIFFLGPGDACLHARVMCLAVIFFGFVCFKGNKLMDELELMSDGPAKTKMDAELFVLVASSFASIAVGIAAYRQDCAHELKTIS